LLSLQQMEISKKHYNFTPEGGRILISEPFLNDPNFRKAVVLLCEHEEEGSFGFILNRVLQMVTSEIIPDLLDYDFPVFYGGPVEPNTLHFIHRCGLIIEDAFPIGNGIYWGGDIQTINQAIASGKASVNDFRFFVGYSGWGAGQLEKEIEEKVWWLAQPNSDLVFTDDLEEMWPMAVKILGNDFAFFANSPDDFLWN
jgi:putative transcriptional regulator